MFNRCSCRLVASLFALVANVSGPLEAVDAGRSPAVRPNVLFILTDDNSTDGLGYSSAGKFLTPNIDRLAREGVILDGFHCPAAICTPSRYSFLTGVQAGNCSSPRFQQAWNNEMYCMNWSTNCESGRATIGTVLHAAGYLTAYTGKWHNGGIDPGRLTMPNIPADADPADPVVATALRTRYEMLRQTVQGFGFDQVESLCWSNVDLRQVTKLRHHNLEWIVRGSIDILDRCASATQPFYLQVNLTVQHGPHHLLSLESDQRVCEYGYSDQPLDRIMPPRSSVNQRLYAAGLEASHATAGRLWLDDAVGAIVEHVGKLGKLDDTVVLVIADNGGSHGKGSLYERGVRIPALVRWPTGVPGGRRNDALLANIDLLPTLATVCGATIPAGMPIDGRNRWPQITGQAPDDREDLFLEIGYSRGVKTRAWKYIATRYPQAILAAMADGSLVKGGKGFSPLGRGSQYTISMDHPGFFDADQLYDLVNDPDERRNLAQDPRHAAVLTDLQGRLRRYLAGIPHPFPLEPQPFLATDAYRRLAAIWAADDAQVRDPYYLSEQTLRR